MIIKPLLVILALIIIAINTILSDMNIFSKTITLISFIPFLGLAVMPEKEFITGRIIALSGGLFTIIITVSLVFETTNHYLSNKHDMAAIDALKVQYRDCDLENSPRSKKEFEENIINSCSLGPIQALHDSLIDIYFAIHIPYEASPLAALLPERNKAKIRIDCKSAYNEMKQYCPSLPKREFH